jgi:hypothetical protein
MLSARMSVSANSGHEFDHLQQGASVIYARYAHIVCTISRRYRTQRNNYCFEKAKIENPKSRKRKDAKSQKRKFSRNFRDCEKRIAEAKTPQSFQSASN